MPAVTSTAVRRQYPHLLPGPRLLRTLGDYELTGLQAVEDRNFKHHPGIDLHGIARAAWANVRAGRAVQGGSTLTQQLVKNFFLTRDRTVMRKANEAIMALLLEFHYEKAEILEAYLNEVFLGQQGAYERSQPAPNAGLPEPAADPAAPARPEAPAAQPQNQTELGAARQSKQAPAPTGVAEPQRQLDEALEREVAVKIMRTDRLANLKTADVEIALDEEIDFEDIDVDFGELEAHR